MGQIKSFQPEKLVSGILIADLGVLDKLMVNLETLWGSVDSQSDPVEFTYSSYYAPEMGSHLYRIFCSFETLVNPAFLAEIKIQSNALEEQFSRKSGRVVNLDPGILSMSKFILASTKNNAHRIPLERGIYGELTLQYRSGEFQELPWTYPDYRGEAARSYLLKVRKIYALQIKNKKINSIP